MPAPPSGPPGPAFDMGPWADIWSHVTAALPQYYPSVKVHFHTVDLAAPGAPCTSFLVGGGGKAWFAGHGHPPEVAWAGGSEEGAATIYACLLLSPRCGYFYLRNGLFSQWGHVYCAFLVVALRRHGVSSKMLTRTWTFFFEAGRFISGSGKSVLFPPAVIFPHLDCQMARDE